MSNKRNAERAAIVSALDHLRAADRALLAAPPCREADRVIASHSIDVALERLTSRLATLDVADRGVS